MNILQNLDLLSVGVIVASTGILGFVVFFNNSKSQTAKTFLIFCIFTIFWGALNYLSYNITIPELALWMVRFSTFIAVLHSLFLFQMLYVFPDDLVTFPKAYTYGLVPLTLCASLINLTPFTFHHIVKISAEGRITQIANGPGIALFTSIILGLICGGIIVFIKKLRARRNIPPRQFLPILIGIITTFALILSFNFVLPAFLNNSRYIGLGAVFIFPFVLGSGYSIFRHNLLNVKIVSTEIITFILALIILIEVVTSTTLETLLLRLTIFIAVIVVGIILIKSVMKEVKQREELQILTSELGNANEKLQTLDQARAEFISIASHQLRTPPATIKWYLSAVLSGDYGELPKEVFPVLKKTEQTNNHLISLIEDMLNVSRIERGKMEFLFEPANLEELARFAYEQLLPIAHDKKLLLTYEPPAEPLPPVTVDKEKLRQVMNNLIDNALKYTKAGVVKVKISKAGESIRFEVRDSGKGISREDRETIFHKYTRGKESIKQSAGLGLGLYVARIIIEQHKGNIWAESPGEGKGSTFAFTLPINNKLEATSIDLGKAN